MAIGVNFPVLVGGLPLLNVQRMTLDEGYRVEKISGSRFSQLITPTTRTLTIDVVLTGRERLILKKGLEALALTSRALASAAAPALALAGIPVISLFTILLDMQITDLRFENTIDPRDAVKATIRLAHVPRHMASEIVGESLDLALAAASAAIPTTPPPNPIPRAA
ncbi:hypothetical protein [Conexibacter woesei]|uniref:Uncharacterized protein n=1 Tax=Conexibacter woesei (strain DSM 14684 / CCUG 47730 / CIP 108061 / JCM 11494 / NBRC 100937 / ID131577) TaxID=469383 RepID=D3FC79_CONWI|nr:hypothetical protein [Conexibacter woesei]ADB53374.1 hypothetical protein Cwoe_4963 [Conexibacter woesei DSM 14684]